MEPELDVAGGCCIPTTRAAGNIVLPNLARDFIKRKGRGDERRGLSFSNQSYSWWSPSEDGLCELGCAHE
jgi:hypothetical protein